MKWITPSLQLLKSKIDSFKCNHGFHKHKKVAYGYPILSTHWTNIYVCKRCGIVRREIDDLFAENRPKSYKKYVNYMNVIPGFTLLIDIVSLRTTIISTDEYQKCNRDELLNEGFIKIEYGSDCKMLRYK